MARDVARWVVVTLAAWGVIAIALLPPRGVVTPSRARFFALAEATPARLRAQALAGEWRSADGAARLLEQRARARAERRGSGPAVVFTGIASVPPGAMPLVTAALDSVWAALGLAETKIRVVVVIELATNASARRAAGPTLDTPLYLEPDSTDRTTCVALLPAGRYWSRVILGEPVPERWRGQFVRWLRGGLGPCAFYATFGAPSRPVRQWLTARNWDLGLFLDTDGSRAAEASSTELLGEPRFSWYWERIYSYPAATVACMAGRPSGCRTAVLRGANDESDELPRVIRLERRWWQTQHLLPAERYLSDVARTVGRDRFLRFWGSPLPVNTALAAALKKPVGEWTAEWQQGYTPRLRLGAAAPLASYVLALVVGALVVLGVAGTSARRQVR